MDYTKADLNNVVKRFGEAFVVLDSDREYKIHGQEEYDYKESPSGETMVRAEGKSGDEWVKVEFPLDAVEHVYSHREV